MTYNPINSIEFNDAKLVEFVFSKQKNMTLSEYLCSLPCNFSTWDVVVFAVLIIAICLGFTFIKKNPKSKINTQILGACMCAFLLMIVLVMSFLRFWASFTLAHLGLIILMIILTTYAEKSIPKLVELLKLTNGSNGGNQVAIGEFKSLSDKPEDDPTQFSTNISEWNP